ncbi:MAG: magnesium transporter [Pseudonocardiaceae bacterium]|nr:magnesium transporter [Pseudonocardiaceae bacterium]
MTTAFALSSATPNMPTTPTLPTGWPIGSYDSYEQAQRAVDHLADSDFPVADVTIVGVEPMLVERVAAKLTLGRVMQRGIASGAWFGLFVGLLLSLINPGAGMVPILIGLISGVGFGVAFSAAGYATTKKRRRFVSHSQLVARRYDVLSQPRNAERGRDMLATFSMKAPARS